MTSGEIKNLFLCLAQGTRLRTLTATFVPVAVATALACVVLGPSGSIDWALGALALGSALFIQIGTNLFNDALDFKKGADTPDRVGPRRLTQSGALSFETVWWSGVACFFLAAFLALPLIFAAGKVILLIGLASLLAGYLYTGGPRPLAYLGLGEISVLIFFGWVPIFGMMAIYGASEPWLCWLAGTQLGFLSVVLIAINNLRDRLGDQKAGKKTLAVRFGVKFARIEIAALLLLPFALGHFWRTHGEPWAAFLPLLALPLALRPLLGVIRTEPGEKFNSLLGQAALAHLSFGILLCSGLLLSSRP